MRPSRFDHVKECSSIENIPHAAENKKRVWKKKLRPIDALYSAIERVINPRISTSSSFKE